MQITAPTKITSWRLFFRTFCFTLALSGLAPNVNAKPLAVFVSILPQKYMVERIGKQHVTVTSMLGKNQSPTTYEPTPRQMALLANCDIYFTIGIPFEKKWIKRIAEVNPALTLIASPQPYNEKGHRHAQDLDPHIWTSPSLLKALARDIKSHLARVDPRHNEDYQRNLERFIDEIVQLDNSIKRMLDESGVQYFMVYHPAWDHYAQHYGLKQIVIERQGKEPGAKTITQLIQSARQHGIDKIFVQAQFDTRSAETIARAINARVVVVDPLAENVIDSLHQFTRQLVN